VVKYSYVASGERYSGEWQTPNFFRPAQVSDFVTRHFPPGQIVTVRYDPKKPERSLIEVDPEICRAGMIQLNLR
jgi:hypothetical protein